MILAIMYISFGVTLYLLFFFGKIDQQMMTTGLGISTILLGVIFILQRFIPKKDK